MLQPGSARNDAIMKFFFYFLFYFYFFNSFRNAPARFGQKWYWDDFFFFFFSQSWPGSTRNEAKMIFFFESFKFFLEMLQPNLGINDTRAKFFFLFFTLSQLSSSRNDAIIKFFFFFSNFISIFLKRFFWNAPARFG